MNMNIKSSVSEPLVSNNNNVGNTSIQANNIKSVGKHKVNNNLIIASTTRTYDYALSLSLRTVNKGMTMSSVAQSGLEQHTQLLQNIKKDAQKLQDQELSMKDRQTLMLQIKDSLSQAMQVTDQTKFNSSYLLKDNAYSTNDLSIFVNDDFVQIKSVDTESVFKEIQTTLQELLKNPELAQKLLEQTDQAMSQLANFKNQFSNSKNQLKQSASDFIQNANKQIQQNIIDQKIKFKFDITDFNNTGLLSQIGNIAQTQQNVSKDSAIKLLT